uniref:YfcC family protein n=1 Tax=Olsenella timonensis TaxID=1805478 RepID=UPI00094E7871|nr:YfcC family protein [Olsenella timonensis]
MSEKKKFRFPNPYILLLIFLALACAMTFLIPAGSYEREVVEGISNPVVVPDTYAQVANTPVTLGTLLGSIAQGMGDSAAIIFLIFFSAGTFAVFNKTGAIENGIGVMIRKINSAHIPSTAVIWLLTFLFSILGFVSGPDALVPFTLVAVSIALGLGYDLILGLALVLAGSGIGFSFSPINAAVVGTPQSIIGLPIFSGMEFRVVMWFVGTCLIALMFTLYGNKVKAHPEKSSVADVDTSGLSLSKGLDEYALSGRQIAVLVVFVLMFVFTVVGSLEFGWYLNEISGIFLVAGIVAGLIYGLKTQDIINGFVEGGASVAGTALLIGIARAIQVVLTEGNVLDTIIYYLSGPLSGMSPIIAGIFISVVVCIVHFFITSGSGLSVAMVPIIAPLGIMAGLSAQTTVLAFQVGGSVLNMIIPTLGSTMAMCGLARVPYSKWLKVGWKMCIPVVIVAWLFIILAVFIGY